MPLTTWKFVATTPVLSMMKPVPNCSPSGPTPSMRTIAGDERWTMSFGVSGLFDFGISDCLPLGPHAHVTSNASRSSRMGSVYRTATHTARSLGRRLGCVFVVRLQANLPDAALTGGPEALRV